MKEKVWTRRKDGTYSVEGEIEVSNVYVSYLRDGIWSTPYATQKRKEAEVVIEQAIARGQVTAEAYRLTPAKGAEIILEKKRKIMAEARKSLGKEKEPDWVEDFPVEGKSSEKPKEEKEMAKAKKVVKKASKAEAAEKVGGLFRDGTALAYLYEVFEDEKPHSIKKLYESIISKFVTGKSAEDKQKQADWRVRRFREKGEETGKFALIRDSEEGTLQLKFGKAAVKAAKAPVKKVDKKVAKAVNGSGKKLSGKAPVAGKAVKLTAFSVRQTLANEKGPWTKNKMIEFLGEKFEVSPDTVKAAIKYEVGRGGMTDENGVLELA